MVALLTLCAYGALVLTSLWLCWRNPVVQAVGWALTLSWVASIAAHYWVPVSDQPQAYTICETAVFSMAFFSHVLGGGRAMIALVAVSLLSICTNFYVSTFDVLTKAQLNAWEMATNICFVAENLLVIVPRVYDRARTRLDTGRSAVASHATAAGSNR